MTSVDSAVRASWERIDAWCGKRLRPTPVRAASDERRLRAIEAELAVPLPAGVREWWALDGVGADYWIPGAFAPVDMDEALETRDIWLLVAEEEGPSFDAHGEPEERFLPAFLPIAMNPGGDGLVVDLRLGETRGAVFLWDHETWVLGVPWWDSLASMLRDIADALEAGTPALLRHAALGGGERPCTAVVDEDGGLAWEAAADR
ncbi:SMI1/KNR4 family protein [Streptomyces sp. NPDC054887]